MLHRSHRSGLTLLEVVLSLGIFVGALAALSQLATNGTRATVQARLKTQATIRCEAKLNEVLAGVEPMQSRGSTAFPDDSRWTWSEVVTPSANPQLVQIDLTVSHRGTSRLASVDVTLRRWAREQTIFVRGATQVKEEEEKAKARTRMKHTQRIPVLTISSATHGLGNEFSVFRSLDRVHRTMSRHVRCRFRFRSGSKGTRTGFTLLETILALSLSALLLGAIYAAIDQSWRTSASGREEMERAQLARALIHKIEIDIRAITFVPPPPVDETAETTSTTSTSSSSTGVTTGSNTGGGGSTGSGGSGSGGGSSSSKNSGGGSGGSSKSGGSSGGSSKSGSGGSTGGGSSSTSGGGAASASTGNAGSSTDAATDAEPLPPNSKSVGIRGTSLKMEMSIARPRRDLLPGTTSIAGVSRTSDLRQVSYSFVPPGTMGAGGLVRTEGDRMAVEVLEASGSTANQISSVQMLAPEVAAFRVRYFDGRMWSETWDTDTLGRIPRAVEVSIAFTPPKRQPSIFSAPVSRSMDSFRTVVLIPVSDPYPKDFLP